jgi:hypothetical protein
LFAKNGVMFSKIYLFDSVCMCFWLFLWKIGSEKWFWYVLMVLKHPNFSLQCFAIGKVWVCGLKMIKVQMNVAISLLQTVEIVGVCLFGIWHLHSFLCFGIFSCEIRCVLSVLGCQEAGPRFDGPGGRPRAETFGARGRPRQP